MTSKLDKSLLSTYESAAVQNVKKDFYSLGIKRKIEKFETLQKYFDDTAIRTASFDLTGYNFEADPDCSIVTKV